MSNSAKFWVTGLFVTALLFLWFNHMSMEQDREFEEICARLDGVAVVAEDGHHCFKRSAFVD